MDRKSEEQIRKLVDGAAEETGKAPECPPGALLWVLHSIPLILERTSSRVQAAACPLI